MTLHYKFADRSTATTAHEAIDDARLGAADRHWPDGKTERHTTLTRNGADYLIAVTEFTEQVRRDGRVVLPAPVEVTVDRDGRNAEVECIDPKRTDVLAARRG